MPDSDQRTQREPLSRHARPESPASLISSRSRHEYSRSSLAATFLYLAMPRLERTKSRRTNLCSDWVSQPTLSKKGAEKACAAVCSELVSLEL